MRAWARQYQSNIIVCRWLRESVPSLSRPSPPDALLPSQGRTIYGRDPVNGSPFHAAMRAIYSRSDLTLLEKAVAWAMLDPASQDGLAWPAVDTIAAACSVSDRRVRPAIARLVSLGVVAVATDSRGRRPKTYQFNPDILSINPDNRSGFNPDNASGLPGQQVRVNPDILSTNPDRKSAHRLKTVSLNDSLNEKKETQPEVVPRGTPADETNLPTDPERDWQIMQALTALNHGNPATVKGIYRTKAAQVADEYGLESVLEALRFATENGKPFAAAMARVRSRTWAEANRDARKELSGTDPSRVESASAPPQPVDGFRNRRCTEI